MHLSFTLQPLRVIKQVASMFCSVNPVGGRIVETLAPFVLNEHARGLPAGFRFFAYAIFGMRRRIHPFLVQMGRHKMGFSEIAVPPLGLILTVQGEAPNIELMEFTHFAWAGFDEIRTDHYHIPVLHADSPFPADFRTAEKLERDRLENVARYGPTSGKPEAL